MKPLSVRAGSVIVKVYRAIWAGKVRWEVRWRFGGKTERRKFTDKRAALLLAEQKAAEISNGFTARYRLTEAEAWEAEQARDILQPIGKTILQVSYEEQERARAAASAEQGGSGLAVVALVEQFISAKTAQGASAYHLRDFRTRLGRFANDFRIPLGLLRGVDVASWLDSLRVGPRTWNNYRAALAALFAYGESLELIRSAAPLLAASLPRTIARIRPAIFTPEQMRLLLQSARESLVPALALGAFAGLRSEEVLRLRWEDVNWTSGYILLREQITKTRLTRQVPILPALRDWLEPWHAARGLVASHAHAGSLSGVKRMLARRLGFRWCRNGLRKSFISYRVAATSNIPQTALECGNSPAQIHARYLDLATPAQAAEWFGIRPKTVTSGLLKLQFA